MTKILNLDELPTNIEQKIIYKGEEHFFKQMTVDEFIATVRAAEEMKDGDETDVDTMSRRVTVLKESIATSFPTLAKHIPDMPFNTLMAIFEFLAKTAETETEKMAADIDVSGSAEGNELEATEKSKG